MMLLEQFIISVQQHKLLWCFVQHLLAVLAVHHPHLPADLILQLSQQQRVSMGHNCTLLEP